MVVANISQEEKESEIIRKYNCMIFCITWNEKSLLPTQYLCFIMLGFSWKTKPLDEVATPLPMCISCYYTVIEIKIQRERLQESKFIIKIYISFQGGGKEEEGGE